MPGYIAIKPLAIGALLGAVFVLPAAVYASDSANGRIDYWAVEDPKPRAELPFYKVIPAAKPEELTPASGFPKPESYSNWHRSHGDSSSSRYSSLDQINRDNIKDLEVAWTYHSEDGKANIQANPIIVEGVMYAPTTGNHLVAINAATGKEIWRIKPGGRPAHRGLMYWPGDGRHSERLVFCSGDYLHAVNPATGKPIASFGDGGKIKTGEVRAAPAIFERVIVVAGYVDDVFGFDLITGKPLWTFHTIPEPGEFGHDTWDAPDKGANCWGGIAVDEQRGMVFITTGSPKPNGNGPGHRGRNLFANCMIALDAKTGERLWHFQEIRHDFWDLDIPAPPNLVTITRDGKRIDAVAAVTKLGNTLLLDRLSGKPIFPFRMRRAPTSPLAGEVTWPYQPDLEIPEPFSRQLFTRDEITDISAESHEYIETQVNYSRFGWFETFELGVPTIYFNIHGGGQWTGASFDPTTGWLYVNANEIPWIITVIPVEDRPPSRGKPTPGETVYKESCAACHGVDRRGQGVGSPLLSLKRRLTESQVHEVLDKGSATMLPAPEMTSQQREDLMDFLFDRDWPATKKPATKPKRPSYTYLSFKKLLDAGEYPGCKPPWGTLNAIDLNTGKLVWQKPLGEYEELTFLGVPKTGTENFGGATVTGGGLVFCAGTRDEKIRAFDKETGEELWEHKLPWGGYAPPATYMAGNKQYVVIAATGGGKLGGPKGDAYVAFALPDGAE